MFLTEIHNYLENNVIISNNIYEVTKYISSKKNDDLPNEIKNKIDIEKAIFSIIDHIKPKRLEWTSKAYDIISQDYDYIVSRIAQTQNSLLKAIYSEILYHSNEAEYKSYIKNVIESYYEVLNKAFEDLSTTSSKDFVHSIVDIMTKLLHQAVLSNSNKLKDIKILVLKFLQVDNNIELYHYLIVSIIKLMLEYKKTFKKADFEGVDGIFWNLVQLKFKEGDYHYVISIISQYAHEIDKKRQKLSYPWDDILGDCFVKLMNSADSNIVARHWCINAIKHYTRLNKHTKKISALERKYTTFKDKLEFTEINTPVDTAPFIEPAKNILQMEENEIYKLLSVSNSFYPPIESLKSSNDAIYEICPISFLDHNMHPAKVSNLNTELDYCLKNYGMYWQLYQITVDYILLEGIKNRKISLQGLLSFLMDYSFFFDLIPLKVSTKKKQIKYNWSSTVISIFATYFKEIEIWQQNPKKYYPFLVTITDSLVLKFETWIRHYLSCYKQPTIASLPQEQGVIREKDLNYLLYDEFITEQFEPNDLLYFRYLFIAKEGWNLRNDIAHGNLNPEQYTIELFNLIFFAFLRLAKYKFPTAEKNRLIKNRTKIIIKH